MSVDTCGLNLYTDRRLIDGIVNASPVSTFPVWHRRYGEDYECTVNIKSSTFKYTRARGTCVFRRVAYIASK